MQYNSITYIELYKRKTCVSKHRESKHRESKHRE